MQAAPLIVAALGTVATISAEQRAANDRRKILNQQLERTDAASKNAAQQALQEGQRFTQDNREQGLQQAEDKGYQQTQADLQGAGGASIAGAADAGNVSDDFLKTKAARAIDEGNRLTSIARETAKARAPGQLRMDDSLSMANLAGNLQDLWGTTRNMAGANSLDAQSVRPPAYGSLGKIATAAGGAMGSYGQTSGGGINFGAR
jgi:hypothetical protein